MADSVRSLRRTLERERTAPRGRDEEVVTQAPSLVIPLMVGAVALAVPLIVLGLRHRNRGASDADPLFQPL